MGDLRMRGLKQRSFKRPARQAEGLTDPALTLRALSRNKNAAGEK